MTFGTDWLGCMDTDSALTVVRTPAEGLLSSGGCSGMLDGPAASTAASCGCCLNCRWSMAAACCCSSCCCFSGRTLAAGTLLYGSCLSGSILWGGGAPLCCCWGGAGATPLNGGVGGVRGVVSSEESWGVERGDSSGRAMGAMSSGG